MIVVMICFRSLMFLIFIPMAYGLSDCFMPQHHMHPASSLDISHMRISRFTQFLNQLFSSINYSNFTIP